MIIFRYIYIIYIFKIDYSITVVGSSDDQGQDNAAEDRSGGICMHAYIKVIANLDCVSIDPNG